MGQYFARTFAERNEWADAGTIVEMFRALNEPDPLICAVPPLFTSAW